VQGDEERIVAERIGHAVGLKIAQIKALRFRAPLDGFAPFRRRERTSDHSQALHLFARVIIERSHDARP
jgi:hypothetical protein